MRRGTKAVGFGAAALMAAGLVAAEPTNRATEEATAAPPPPSLEYRRHPNPRRGYDRIRRATPPRVEIESRGRRYDYLPYSVWVDPWRRRPSRH